LLRCRSPLFLVSVVSVAALSLLAGGCGGGGSPRVANVASSTTAATTTAATTTQVGTPASALAFARCMRAHGIPNWPDPNSQGFFDKSKLRTIGLNKSRVIALEQGPCNIPLPSGGQSQTITPADRADYLKAATCMRAHGFPAFPDPTFQNNNVQTNIPSSVDQNSPRFRSAAETCTKLIPAGLPYSRSGHS